MKKKKFNKKLSLNKETISKLDASKIDGGVKVPTGTVCSDAVNCATEAEGQSCAVPNGSWCNCFYTGSPNYCN